MSTQMRDIEIRLNKAGKFVVQAPPWRVNECRGIPSRRFVRSTRQWVAPATRLNCKYLLDTFAGARWERAALDAAREGMQLKLPTTEPFPSWYKFKTEPRGFQRRALDYAWSASAFALFMPMGSGKSKTTIDLACARALNGEIQAAAIACPASVMLSWRDEILRHATVKSTIIRPRTRDADQTWPVPEGVDLAEGFIWYLIGLEALSQGAMCDMTMARFASSGRPLMLVIDESARIKTPTARRTKSALRLATLSKRRLILSGLPLLAGPLDLFPQFTFLDPKILGTDDFYSFRNRYAVMGGYEGREVIGYQNIEELTGLLAPYVFQINKEEALPDLPPKSYKTITVELTAQQRAQIRRLKRPDNTTIRSKLESILRQQQTVAGAELEPYLDEHGDEKFRVKPFADNPKLDALREVLQETTEPVVIWCNYRFEVSMVSELAEALGRAPVVHYGAMSQEDCKQAIDAFQAGKADTFVSTVAKGGIGITLTAASTAIYYSNNWSLEHRKQSEDRIHRIGQTSDRCLYIDIVAEDSVDELIREAIERKMDVEQYIRAEIRSGSDRWREMIG